MMVNQCIISKVKHFLLKIFITVVTAFAMFEAQAASYDVTGIFSVYDPAGTQVSSQTMYPGGYDDSIGEMWIWSSPFFGPEWWGADITISPFGVGQLYGDITFTGAQAIAGTTVNIWNVLLSDGVLILSSTDVDGDGIPGTPFLDGAFVGFSASFDELVLTPVTAPVPVPSAVWLFGSGLIGLFGWANRR